MSFPKTHAGKEGDAPDASQELKHEQYFRHMFPTLRKRGSPPTIDVEVYSQASRTNRYRRYQAVRTLGVQSA